MTNANTMRLRKLATGTLPTISALTMACQAEGWTETTPAELLSTMRTELRRHGATSALRHLLDRVGFEWVDMPATVTPLSPVVRVIANSEATRLAQLMKLRDMARAALSSGADAAIELRVIATLAERFIEGDAVQAKAVAS